MAGPALLRFGQQAHVIDLRRAFKRSHATCNNASKYWVVSEDGADGCLSGTRVEMNQEASDKEQAATVQHLDATTMEPTAIPVLAQEVQHFQGQLSQFNERVALLERQAVNKGTTDTQEQAEAKAQVAYPPRKPPSWMSWVVSITATALVAMAAIKNPAAAVPDPLLWILWAVCVAAAPATGNAAPPALRWLWVISNGIIAFYLGIVNDVNLHVLLGLALVLLATPVAPPAWLIGILYVVSAAVIAMVPPATATTWPVRVVCVAVAGLCCTMGAFHE